VAALQRMAGGLPAFGIVAAGAGRGEHHGLGGPAAGGARRHDRLGAGRAPSSASCWPTASSSRWPGLLEQKVDEAGKEFQCIKTMLLASMQGYAPPVAIEFGRKVLYSHRPADLHASSRTQRQGRR
jgi:chemotaxis protein MotA